MPWKKQCYFSTKNRKVTFFDITILNSLYSMPQTLKTRALTILEQCEWSKEECNMPFYEIGDDFVTASKIPVKTSLR